MPRLVDHAERRREIAQAVWELADERGLTAASLREVAARGGWSLGALRHYVDSRDALLELALHEMLARVRERVLDAVADAHDRRELLLGALDELLPFDEQRRIEAGAWLQLMAGAEESPTLRDARAGAYARYVAAIEALLAAVADELDGDERHERAQRFVALADGLALQALARPDGMDGLEAQRDAVVDLLLASD